MIPPIDPNQEMKKYPQPLDLSRLRVYPLRERRSLSRIEDILVDPDRLPSGAVSCGDAIARCARSLFESRKAGASILLIYGAHLVKNGGAPLLQRLMDHGFVTHLATNGAGAIHDWEFAFQGWSTESVEQNVATGTFGTWEETGRNIHLALLAGGMEPLGFGQSLGKFIAEDGCSLPDPRELEEQIRQNLSSPENPARADLLLAMQQHQLPAGRQQVSHPWRTSSIFYHAWQKQIPLTVHPGIGYDIISNHPMFNGAVLGRAAGLDFRLFGTAVEGLDHGAVLSIGSAIMGPQVFEKSISCVNNIRLQTGRPIVRDHQIFVVDLQDGGQWDWSRGEPPRDNPAYYLRFCKSFSRMGGAMHYFQCDNVLFLHHLWRELKALSS